MIIEVLVMLPDIGTEVAVVNVTEAQVLIPDITTKVGAMSQTGVWALQVQVKKVMNPVGVILYIMNTVLAVVNMTEARVLIPDIATKVGAMSMTGVNQVRITMYIVNTVHPTMNTTVQGVTVHLVQVMLEGLPVHIINTILMEKMVNPVMIIMYIMNTVRVTMIPTVQVITFHQHMMLKRSPSPHSHSYGDKDLESCHDPPGERKHESSDVRYVCHEHSPAYYEHYRSSESRYSASTHNGRRSPSPHFQSESCYSASTCDGRGSPSPHIQHSSHGYK